MTTPVLATKLFPPSRRSGLVVRPRLTAQLDNTLERGNRLTLVSAPAGFGKTTLVGDWVAGLPSQRARVGWLSLDAADNDLPRLLAHVWAALAGIGPDVDPRVLAAPVAALPSATTSVTLTAVVNEIVRAAAPHPDGHWLLVLDDYHVIEAPEVHEAMTFFLDHLPDELRLLMATRSDPPLPLSRLRARGQLTEVRARDLRFAPAEARELLNEVLGLHLSEGDVRSLEERTEGWVAGLQLAALSLRQISDHADVVEFIEAFAGSNRFVVDVLGGGPQPAPGGQPRRRAGQHGGARRHVGHRGPSPARAPALRAGRGDRDRGWRAVPSGHSRPACWARRAGPRAERRCQRRGAPRDGQGARRARLDHRGPTPLAPGDGAAELGAWRLRHRQAVTRPGRDPVPAGLLPRPSPTGCGPSPDPPRGGRPRRRRGVGGWPTRRRDRRCLVSPRVRVPHPGPSPAGPAPPRRRSGGAGRGVGVAGNSGAGYGRHTHLSRPHPRRRRRRRRRRTDLHRGAGKPPAPRRRLDHDYRDGGAQHTEGADGRAGAGRHHRHVSEPGPPKRAPRTDRLPGVRLRLPAHHAHELRVRVRPARHRRDRPRLRRRRPGRGHRRPGGRDIALLAYAFQIQASATWPAVSSSASPCSGPASLPGGRRSCSRSVVWSAPCCS